MKQLLFALLLVGQTLKAGNTEVDVYRLDQAAGISNNCVNSILLDSRHFLWAGTNAGLDFYDGINIVHLSFTDTENDVQPVVFALDEDPSGALWAGTSEGLFRLGSERCTMERFNCTPLEGSSVRSLCCSRGGVLWIAIKGSNLVKINTASGKWEEVPLWCKSACRGHEGQVWFVANDDRILLSADGISDPVPLPDAINDAISGINLSRIFMAGGHLFLASAGDQSYVLDLQTPEVRPLPFLSRMRGGIAHSSGTILVAARDGIYALDSTLALSGIVRPFHDNSFRCIAEDRDGGVWAGTHFEGMARIAPNRLQLRNYSKTFAGGSFKARDFAEDRSGRIWIGTDTRGLLCFDPKNGDETAVQQYFAGRNITGLFSEGHRLWVGTFDSETPVSLLDTETGRITRYADAGTSAYAFCRDKNGKLWVGGKDGFAVGRDRPDGSFEREIFIPSAQICRIILGSDGAVWTASIAGQVFHYAASSFNSYRIPVSNILTDITEDAQGRIFATSEGGGLWEYIPAQDCFKPCPIADPSLLKMASAADGRLLWITGSNGIQILNADDRRPLPQISREALGIDGFNYSSNYISRDGTLYAGTSDGFISFSVGNLMQSVSPTVAPTISSLRILSSSGQTGDTRYLYPASLKIGRRPHSFEVNASTLDYSRLPSAGLFWKIEGYNDWTPVQDGTFKVFDIPSGKWIIKIKALSLSGEESATTEMALQVLPPLLLSPGAFLLYIVAFLLIILLIAAYTDRRAKAKAELEHERQLVASKMDFLTAIAHEIRTPLSLVQIPLEAISRKFASSPDGSVQENLDIMRRNSLKLNVLINELLDFRKLSDATFQIHPEFIDIRNILKDAHRRFLPMFVQEGKTLSISMPDVPVYCQTDIRAIGRIYDNLLSNALKYSVKHTSIQLTARGQDAVIMVENDGKVIPEDVRELIFKPFYRYEDLSAKVEGTGLGLSTSRQFATLLGGTLVMDDDLTTNRFFFSIPMTAESSTASAPISVETKERSVMVIEDDKDMARVIGDILSESYGIIYASDGQEALEKINAGASPSLVVSDIIMPRMDGIKFMKALKGNLATSHIPVVLLSAEVPDTLMQESLEGGADAYIEKPFSPKKLRSTVDNLIQNRKRIYEFYISSLPSSGELPAGRVSTMEQKFLRGIQEYVSANLHRNITLDDLAEVVCLSPSSLYKKMKEYADISPMEYVMKVRLHRAVELLKDDSISVQEVAQAVGFNTHSFFSECFKREFGMTPRQWRMRNVAKAKNAK